MLKGVAATSIVLTTAIALTGCMTRQGDVGNKNIRPNSYRAQSMDGTRFANDGANETNRIHGTQRMNNNVTGLHANSRLEMSQDIANKLAALPEIKSAYVALTNRNAYVAIVEDRGAARTDTYSTRSTSRSPVGVTGNNNITPYSMGAVPTRPGITRYTPNAYSGGVSYYNNNRLGTVPQTGIRTRGLDGTNFPGSTVMGTGSTGNNFGMTPGAGPSSTTGFGTTTGTTPTGTGTSGFGTTGTTGTSGFGTTGTTGTTTGTTGFGTTGTTGTTTGDVSDQLKNQVADIVKGMHPGIDNVYVTANPDFYGRLQSFATDVGNGHPIQGMISQFNALVDRVFPDLAGTGTGHGTATRMTPSSFSPGYTPSTTSRSSGYGYTR